MGFVKRVAVAAVAGATVGILQAAPASAAPSILFSGGAFNEGGTAAGCDVNFMKSLGLNVTDVSSACPGWATNCFAGKHFSNFSAVFMGSLACYSTYDAATKTALTNYVESGGHLLVEVGEGVSIDGSGSLSPLPFGCTLTQASVGGACPVAVVGSCFATTNLTSCEMSHWDNTWHSQIICTSADGFPGFTEPFVPACIGLAGDTFDLTKSFAGGGTLEYTGADPTFHAVETFDGQDPLTLGAAANPPGQFIFDGLGAAGNATGAPEIDARSAVAPLALGLGALLILADRRRRQA